MKTRKLRGIIVLAIVTTLVSPIAPASAEWLKDSEDNWNWIEDGNKSTGWKEIDGTWYHFDGTGKMQTGWIKAEYSKWYYMNPNGSMKIGWLQDTDGKWYNLSHSGEMRTGWIYEADGNVYFADYSGAMLTGVIEVEGNAYAFDKNGMMLIGNKILMVTVTLLRKLVTEVALSSLLMYTI